MNWLVAELWIDCLAAELGIGGKAAKLGIVSLIEDWGYIMSHLR